MSARGGQNGWSPRGAHQKGRDFVSSNPLRQLRISRIFGTLVSKVGTTNGFLGEKDLSIKGSPKSSVKQNSWNYPWLLWFSFDVWTEGDICFQEFPSFNPSILSKLWDNIPDNHINQPTQKIETPSGFGNTRRIRHKLSYRLDIITHPPKPQDARQPSAVILVLTRRQHPEVVGGKVGSNWATKKKNEATFHGILIWLIKNPYFMVYEIIPI